MSKRQMKIIRDEQSGVARWVAPDESAEYLRVSISDVPESLHPQLMLHGLVQTVTDAGALGANATTRERLNAMQARVEQLADGVWSKRPGRTPIDPLRLIAALVELKGDEHRAVITDAVNNADEAKRRKLWDSPELDEILGRNRAGIDDLLAI